MAKRTINKSAWIREQPTSLAAKDVVVKAKREGISLSLAQVYTTRSLMGKAQTSAPARGRPRTAVAGSPSHARSIPELRAEFERIALRLGTEEVQRLLVQMVPSALTRTGAAAAPQ